MLLTGLVQLIFLTGGFAYAYMQTEFTPARIRLRARAVPLRAAGYAAPSA